MIAHHKEILTIQIIVYVARKNHDVPIKELRETMKKANSDATGSIHDLRK